MDFVAVLYGVLLLAGGLIGFMKAGSVASLLAGVTFGSAALYGGHLVDKDPNDVSTLLVTSVLMTLLMGSRFFKNRKFMPAGMLTIMSITIAVFYGSKIVFRNSMPVTIT